MISKDALINDKTLFHTAKEQGMKEYSTNLSAETVSIAEIKEKATGLGYTFVTDRGVFGLEKEDATAFWSYEEGGEVTLVAANDEISSKIIQDLSSF